MAATDCVSFKAYLKHDGQPDEVRRFGIESGAATNFMYLRGKIANMFPSLRNDNFQISWKDQEGDVVMISSDEELVVALTDNCQPLNRIYITAPNNGSSKTSSGEVHFHITCDGCQMQSIQGYRYKCLNCRDFDLCAKCEANGLHSEHFMLRVPVPTNLRPFFNHRFSRSPQRFHRHHSERKGYKHGKEYKSGPHCPVFEGQKNTMGDFLADFLPFLDVTMPHTSNDDSTAQTSSAPSKPQTSNEQNQEDFHIRYLRNIGESIAAFLDPMGIDVAFDVQQKQKDNKDKQTVPATSTSNQDVPVPSMSQDSQKESVQIPVTLCSPANIQSPPTSSVNNTDGQKNETRRSSLDGWTVLNRDTLSRSPSQPMEIDESRGAIPKQVPNGAVPLGNASATSPPNINITIDTVPAPDTRIYPSLSEPSAPQTPQDTLRKGIQEALEKMVSMGFDVDVERLQSLLQSQNGDIAKVVDFLLK